MLKTAYETAVPRGKSMAGSSWLGSTPIRASTPPKPTTAPITATRVTRSPSSGPARATTTKGVVDASVLTEASGSIERARKNEAVAPKLAGEGPPWSHKRSLRERQAVVAVALIQAAGGARRMLAGAAAGLFAIIGVCLILFPLTASAVLAVGALATSLWLAGYVVARQRRRRETDAP